MSDKTLASLTAATAATGGLFYGTQAGADRKFTLTGAGAALLEAGTAAEQRGAMGVGAISTQTGKSACIAGSTNASVLASVGYSLTGSDTTSAVDIAGTWNTTGTPTAVRVNITDTASDAASLLLDLRRGDSTMVSVAKDGALQWGTVGSFDRVPVFFSRGIFGDVEWHQGGGNNVIIDNPINFENAYITLNSFGAAGNGGVMLQGSQMAPNVLQLGNNDPTTPAGQMIKAHDVTTGTGASLMLAGGKGSVAGGAVVLATSTTNSSPNERVIVGSNGTTIIRGVAGPTNSILALQHPDAYMGDGSSFSLSGDGSATYNRGFSASSYLSVIEQGNGANVARLFIDENVNGKLALRNGITAQSFRVYSTYTDGSNYERVACNAAQGDCEIATEAAGSGIRRNILLNGANRAAYKESPSNADIRDILVSHGLMAAS
jgi:hypothetical protein